MERGQSFTPGLHWLWSSFGTAPPGLAGAARHSLFITSQTFAPKRSQSALRSAPARTVPENSMDTFVLPIGNSRATKHRAVFAFSGEMSASGEP
jgi:hypothetical protein